MFINNVQNLSWKHPLIKQGNGGNGHVEIGDLVAVVSTSNPA